MDTQKHGFISQSLIEILAGKKNDDHFLKESGNPKN